MSLQHDSSLELGLDTFGDVTLAADGSPRSQAQLLRHVVDEAVLADQVGVAFFGVGEHHRRSSASTWVTTTRSSRSGSRFSPRCSCSSRSPGRDARGRPSLPLTLAIIGGSATGFVPYADLYRRSLAQFGHATQPVAVHSPGHVAATDELAREQIWPHYQAMMTRIGAARGWPPVSRPHLDREVGPDGSLYVGAPDTVATKIAATVRALGLTRFAMKYSTGALPHDLLMTSIELYGTRVLPSVRKLLASA